MSCRILRAAGVALWVLAATHAPTAAYADENDAARRVLEQIEEQSKDLRTLRSAFEQEKHLAIFDAPLVLRGNLHLQKPDLFAFRVESPLRYRMVIRDDELRQWDEDSDAVQTISLRDNPGFKLVLHQMSGWLSGQYASMLDEYDATVLKEDPVEVRFRPRPGAMAHGIVEQVEVAFEADRRRVREIRILDPGGDRTVFKFHATEINTEIDPSVWDIDTSG